MNPPVFAGTARKKLLAPTVSASGEKPSLTREKSALTRDKLSALPDLTGTAGTFRRSRFPKSVKVCSHSLADDCEGIGFARLQNLFAKDAKTERHERGARCRSPTRGGISKFQVVWSAASFSRP